MFVTAAWMDGCLERPAIGLGWLGEGLGGNQDEWPKSIWSGQTPGSLPSSPPHKTENGCPLGKLVWKKSKWVYQSQQKAGAKVQSRTQGEQVKACRPNMGPWTLAQVLHPESRITCFLVPNLPLGQETGRRFPGGKKGPQGNISETRISKARLRMENELGIPQRGDFRRM